ncbi:MAG: type I pullulanase [Candidatus Methylumidiphilus sp.]
MHTSPKISPLAILEIQAPPGHVGKTVIATLKSNGRIVAQGQSVIAHGDDARIILHLLEHAGQRGSGDYELWVNINGKDCQSWYPGFGDWFIQGVWHFQHGPWKRLDDVSSWREKRLSSPDNRLRIHYHRYGGYSDGVGLWTWNSAAEAQNMEIFAVGQDEFGLIFELDKADYSDNPKHLRLGILPRLGGDWNLKEDDNKYWDASLGDEVYMIGTVNHIWTARPDTRQKVLAAHIDSARCLRIELSRPVDPGEIDAAQISLHDSQNRRVGISHVVAGDKPSNTIRLKIAEPLQAGRNNYVVQVEKFAGTVTALLRGVLDDPHLFCDAHARLGATYSPGATVFRLFAPTADAVEVAIYDRPVEHGGQRQGYLLQKAGAGVFEGTINGNFRGKLYRYRLEGAGLAADREVLDPYCVNWLEEGQYGRITDLAATNPPDWPHERTGPSLASPVDMVVYEMHVRDFTIADNSGVAHKGLYLGATEAAAHLPGHPAISTGLDHLQELGITHVQLLPVQSFNRGGKGRYNWGYMPIAFNSPEGWYASNPDDDSRIRELKLLIGALHARNIGVIMDVVYNHTDHTSPFGLLNPEYYYRFYSKGNYANGSGCGNDFRTESPMGRKFIVDSLKYWVEEYGVDGFRFDLMALIDSETMRQAERELRKLKPDIVLYGEPWSSGHTPMQGQPTDKQAIRGTGIGAFNDHFRNALGGSPNGAEPGFLQNGGCLDRLALGVEGSCRDWAEYPGQSVNYMTCHDNLVLYDKLRWFSPNASEQDILDTMKLGYLLLLTAQGVPLLHAGEEFARTKYGHGNSYNAGDEINRIDWALKAENYDLFCHVRDLIGLRKSHPLFRLRTAEDVRDRLKFHPAPTDKCLVYSIDGQGLADETWREACVLVNGEDASDIDFMLPHGAWFLGFGHNGLEQQAISIGQRIGVRRKSGVVLYSPAPCPDPEESIAVPITESASAESCVSAHEEGLSAELE